MLAITFSILSLLIGIALLLLGTGLQGTLLGLRAVEEQFSVSVIGYVMSFYFAGFAIGTYLCPSLIRRVGHIRAFTAMAAVASSIAMAYILFVDPYVWSLFRILTGICAVGLFMIVESWINTLAPNNLRGQFFSAYMVVTFLALACSQYLLLIGSVTDYILFAIMAMLISSSLLPIALTKIEQPRIVETPKLHLVSVYRQSPLGVIGTFTSGFVLGAFLTMTPVYSSQIGVDKNSIAWLMSTTIFGGAMLQWPIGKLSDHVDRRIVLGLATFSAAILALIIFFNGNHANFGFYAIYFLYGGLAFSIYSLSVAHINDRLHADQALDASKNLLQLYGIGAVAGPLLAGICMQYFGAGSLPLLYMSILLLCAGFTVWRYHSGEAVADDEREDFVSLSRTSPVVMEMDPRVVNEAE